MIQNIYRIYCILIKKQWTFFPYSLCWLFAKYSTKSAFLFYFFRRLKKMSPFLSLSAEILLKGGVFHSEICHRTLITITVLRDLFHTKNVYRALTKNEMKYILQTSHINHEEEKTGLIFNALYILHYTCFFNYANKVLLYSECMHCTLKLSYFRTSSHLRWAQF